MLKRRISGLLRRLTGSRDPSQAARAVPSPSAMLDRLADPKRYGMEEVAGRLRAQQVNAIQRLGIPLMVANLVNVCALLLELGLAGQLSGVAIGWSAMMLLIAVGVLARTARRPRRTVPETASPATIRRIVRSAFLFGLLWAIPGVAILPQLSGMALAFTTALLTGMIAGGAIVLYPVPKAAMAFLVPVTVSGVAGLVFAQGWLAAGPVVLAFAFLYVFCGVVRRHSELFVSEFVARIDLEQRNRLVQYLLETAKLEILGARQLAEGPHRSDRAHLIAGQIAAGVARHFAGLLSDLRGQADRLVADEGIDQELVAALLETCDRGSAAVDALRAAAERQTLTPQAVMLDDIVMRIQQTYAASLAPGIEVVAEVEDQPCMAIADREKLEAAVSELVRNARHAIADTGRIVIACHGDDSGEGDDGAVAITVRDTGCGMDEATCRQATDLFFTTRSGTTSAGIGLPAVAGFARQSGGSLRIESWPCVGTSVTLSLPRDRATVVGVVARPACARKSVLLVESDPELRTTTERLLAELDYPVLVAQDAATALRLLADGHRVDLMLTNILLLGLTSGVQLGHIVQARRPGTRVAFLAECPKGRRKALRPGSQGAALAHPFTSSQLDAHIRKALARSTALA